MKMKKSTLLLIIILLTGLSLMLYPVVSDYWNSFHQAQAIASYTEQVAQIDDEDYELLLEEVYAYNRSLSNGTGRFQLSEEEMERYESLLNISGNGVMGYIELPTIGVSLPVYHGVEDTVLQIAVGHIPGTSLPGGGEGTHCVLSGHRGLPSARLFTDLDKMAVGDTFIMKILDEVLTYEVDQILIVDPDDTSDLEIEEGKDLCTLVTCTPYGVNSHRLLVRGHRVENARVSNARVTADAIQLDPVLTAPLVAAPILLILFLYLMTGSGKKKKKR